MSDKIKNLLLSARYLGIKLWIEDGQLGFSAPKNAETDDLFNTIKKEKQEIISYLVKLSESNMSDYVTPKRVDKTELMPASSAQKRLWFIDKMSEGDSHYYNITFTISFKGNVDIKKIIKSCQKIVNKHDSLRTQFHEQDSMIIQQVMSYFSPLINIYTIDAMTEKNELIAKQAHSIFDLSSSPLFIISIIRNSKNDFFELVFTTHHIIVDGASVNILFEDIVNFYLYEVRDPDTPLLDYIDFTMWQRELLTDSIKSKQLAYWQKKLKDFLPILEYPIDYIRPIESSFVGGVTNHSVDLAQTDIKNWLTQNAISTPFVFFLAAYALFLYRYTSQQTIIIGIPVSNRRDAAFERTVGMFVNSLPIRIDISSSTRFIDLVRNINNQLVELQDNADIPFEDIVSDILPHRDASHAPIFQTMFMYEETVVTKKLPEITIDFDSIETNISKFDISLLIRQSDDSYSASFEYNTSLLDDFSVKQAIKHFTILCKSAFIDPDKLLWEYKILDNIERKYLINDLNDTYCQFEDTVQLTELFERHVNLHANEIAVSCLHESLTYKELNEKINKLAHHLIKAGVGPNIPVGIMLPRSIDAVVAFMAVLKASGTFIPLDPDYPESRLIYSLEDANANVIITSESMIKKIEMYKGEIITVDNLDSVIDSCPLTNPVRRAEMYDLAYIIYTSGSTGKPKGVMIHHLGISHYIQWAIKFYKVKSGSGAPVHSSLAFDLTITSIFAPLCCGRQVFMIPDELGLQGLIDALNMQQDYSLIKLTPMHLKVLQTEISIDIVEKLHACVVIGGEALFEDDVSFWQKNGKKMRFINEYGATETSVADTIYELPAVLPKTSSLPVGKAIDNSQMYILDAYLNPLPIGVIGEIYLSGVGLAKGYLNMPDKTAEKFMKHPFSDAPEEKIYKTGD
ncbi:MAG: amino acid adenylation domain-containing protein, partial [Gammaproteobacteria bacterium]